METDSVVNNSNNNNRTDNSRSRRSLLPTVSSDSSHTVACVRYVSPMYRRCIVDVSLAESDQVLREKTSRQNSTRLANERIRTNHRKFNASQRRGRDEKTRWGLDRVRRLKGDEKVMAMEVEEEEEEEGSAETAEAHAWRHRWIDWRRVIVNCWVELIFRWCAHSRLMNSFSERLLSR